MPKRSVATAIAFAVAVAGSAAVTAPAAADEPPAPAVEVHGFVSTAWTYGLSDPDSKTLGLRVFDFDHNSIKVDVAEVAVLRPVTEPGQWGFRVDLTAGASIPRVTASAGLFRGSDGNAGDFDLQQAFGSYIAPVGRGLRIDAGKFVTHMGAEVIEGYDFWNDNYSRSFLFGYAIPFTHTGVRFTLPIGDTTALMLMIANGWDNVKDNNDMKTLGLQLALNPSNTVSLYLNYVGGPEQNGNNDNLRHVIDVVAVFKPADVMAITINADLGIEKDAVNMNRDDATWWGVAFGLRYSVSSAVDVALRGEIFRDEDGARTGVDQRLMEGTFTVAFKKGNFVFRPELRVDSSDKRVFLMEDPSKTQASIALNALAAF